ncbi:MAG: hypothetical protein ABUL41_00205 [Chitinophagaceae bacterium]
MENEKILTVLTEMLDDQKDNTKMLITLKSSVEELEARMDSLCEIINRKSPGGTTVDSGFQNLVMARLEELKKIAESSTKRTGHEKRILLFPEHNAREYYSVILKWILYIIIATYSYWLLKDFTPNYK